MKGRGLAVGAFVAAIVVGVWIWKSKQRDTPATPAPTQLAGSGSATRTMPGTTPDAAPASIAVAVTDAKGPISNATIRLAPEDGDVVVVKSGADGVARADGLAPGTWAISASAADHEPAALPAEQLDAGEAARLAITLVAGGRKLTGTVTDVTGGPVAGARIDAARSDGGRPSRAFATTVTGADGTYELSVAEGMLLVAARSADYAAQSRHVEVGPAGATADFALVPGGVIEGVVLDEKTRQPMARARVLAMADRGGPQMFAGGGRVATTNADGRFRLTGLSPGAYAMDAQTGKLRTRTSTVVGLGVAEQLTDVALLVGEAAVVRGKVVDEANAPVANATVQVRGPGRGADATTDASGMFELAGLSPGKYAVWARSEQHLPAGMTSLEMTDRDVGGVIVQVRAGLTVKGHVEPRQICDVSLEPADDAPDLRRGPAMFAAPTTTGTDGAFALGPVAAGRGTLVARCPSGEQGSVAIEVAPAIGEVIVKVTPGASIAGRVVDKDGKPVAGVTVTAAPQGGVERTMIVNGMVTSGVKALTNGGGTFELKGLAPGTYRTSVLDRGQPLRLRGKAPTVTLAAQERKTGVEIAVDRATGKIDGIVTGPDGKPLADAWVSVHQDLESMLRGMRESRDGDRPSGGQRTIMVQAIDEDDGDGAGQFAPALTDASGKFTIGGLPHGTYHVLAEAQQGKLRGRAANVTPDATVTIQALGLSTLSGTVKGTNGPAALFSIELDGPTRTQRSFTNGTFELGRVDPGNYTLRVHSSEGNAAQQVVVAAGTPTKVDIVLVANAIVIGRIVDGAGQPLEGMPVTVVDDVGGGLRIALEGPPPTSGPDGKFRVEHQAGPSMLVVMAPPRPVTKRGLALEAGKTLDVGDVRVERAPSPP